MGLGERRRRVPGDVGDHCGLDADDPGERLLELVDEDQHAAEQERECEPECEQDAALHVGDGERGDDEQREEDRAD
ncbi:MAG: hypothetical protein ACKORK_01340, partial [Gemmatimonadota bacterium]